MKVYHLLYKQTNGKKVNWLRVGVLINRGDRFSLKLDVIPCGEWDGWLIVSDKQTKEEPF